MKIKKRINLSIVIFVVSAVLIFIFGIYSVFKNIEMDSRKSLHQEKELAVLEAKIANLENFKTASRDFEEISEKIDNLFIDLLVPVDFIRFLENMAQSHYLDIGISPAAADKSNKDQWQSLVFQVTSRGSFSDLLRFLEKLENSLYLTEVQNLNIAREGEGVRAVFSIKVFAR